VPPSAQGYPLLVQAGGSPARHAESTAAAPPDFPVARLAATLGVHPQALDLDAPLPSEVLAGPPDPAHFTASLGFRESVVRLAEEERLTARELMAQLAGGGGHRKIVGSPEQVADTIEHWFRSGAADGFNLMPDRFPDGLEAFTDHVVPPLRKRGCSATSTSTGPCATGSACRSLLPSGEPSERLLASNPIDIVGERTPPRRHPSQDHQVKTTQSRRNTVTVTQRRELGSSGLAVSALGLGFMSFVNSAEADEERQATALVDEAIDLGINFFDTADVYGPEVSEILLGRAIRGRRDSLIIATKFGNALDRDTNPDGRRLDGRPEYVRQAVEGSLRRLGIDHIDLYYQHRVDPAVPIEETVAAL
jgi:hypothetical protein